MSNGESVTSALKSVWQVVVAPLIVAGIIALFAWVWAIQQQVSELKSRSDVSESRLATIEKYLERIDSKVDRLLESK